MKTMKTKMSETQVVINIDDEEQISLRDFGYLEDTEFDDPCKIAEALHSVISDLYKMITK